MWINAKGNQHNMRAIRTLWARELAACFLSPIAYVMMVAFLLVSGLSFLVTVFKNEGRPEPLSMYLFAGDAIWLPILIAVVTMRLFAEELRSGTIENLMTVPITDFQIVLGKFLGAYTFLVAVLAPTALFVVILERISPGLSPADLDPGAFLWGGVILFLVTGLFLSVGMFCSLLSQNQIIAAILSISLNWLLLLAGWLLLSVPGVDPEFATFLSITAHIEDFARGSVEARQFFFYVTSTLFMLFVSVRTLQARRLR
jgi:ABC-2 type transport system permease protein